jgi:hypothetical protein
MADPTTCTGFWNSRWNPSWLALLRARFKNRSFVLAGLCGELNYP